MGTTQGDCDPPTPSQADAPRAENQADQWINGCLPLREICLAWGSDRNDPITGCSGVPVEPRRLAPRRERDRGEGPQDLGPESSTSRRQEALLWPTNQARLATQLVKHAKANLAGIAGLWERGEDQPMLANDRGSALPARCTSAMPAVRVRPHQLIAPAIVGAK